jgi:transcriptional regulator with XRE-family HTH domain
MKASLQVSKASLHERLLSSMKVTIHLNMDLASRERLSVLVKKARGTMTKSAFAEMLKVSHTAVGSWEQGLYMPDIKSLVNIAQILDLSVEELLREIEGKNSSIGKNFDLNQMVRDIKHLQPKELAVINMAVADRFYAIAESVG